MSKILYALLALIVISVVSQANEIKGKSYADGHGGRTFFPLGDISFVDEVVSFEMKEPHSTHNSNPEKSLSVPDTKTLSLSCGGTVTLAFTDNSLVDIVGPDLYIFEVGPAIEPTSLSISKDGVEWIEIGKVSGGKAEVDIGPYVNKNDIFRFVRLTDLKSGCGGGYPGADIDAVGAIGSAVKLSLTSSILFDSGKAQLKSGADVEIAKQIRNIVGYDSMNIVVEGHTDNVGGTDTNVILSKERALAVKEYLVNNENINPASIEIKGYGETQPIGDNSTEEGRKKNRRVELIFSYKTYDNNLSSLYKSCDDIKYQDKNASSGVYTVSPLGTTAFKVYCEMDIDSGGWTEFGLLTDAKDNFEGSFGVGSFRDVTCDNQEPCSVNVNDLYRSEDNKFDLMIQYGEEQRHTKILRNFEILNGVYFTPSHGRSGVFGQHGALGITEVDGYYATYCAYYGGCKSNGLDYMNFSENAAYPNHLSNVPCGYSYTNKWKNCSDSDNVKTMRYFIRESRNDRQTSKTEVAPLLETLSSVHFSASSHYRNANDHAPALGRMNEIYQTSNWSTNTLDKKQWIMVDLGKEHNISAIATKGRYNKNQYVKTYILSYSQNGYDWTAYKDAGEIVVFDGNSDRDTLKKHELKAFNARYIKFHPQSWHEHITMRVEVYGK